MSDRLPQHADEPAWYVVRTMTKREHVTATLLGKNVDCEVFAPRMRYKKATKRGTIWWVEAMFPGYFFAKFSYTECYRHVQSQPGVTGLVNFAGQAPAIDDAIITTLREHLAAQQLEGADGDMLQLAPSIHPGDEVEVISGPFAGEKALVSSVRPAIERVSLLMEFLGETKEIEFDLYALATGRPRPLAVT